MIWRLPEKTSISGGRRRAETRSLPNWNHTVDWRSYLPALVRNSQPSSLPERRALRLICRGEREHCGAEHSITESITEQPQRRSPWIPPGGAPPLDSIDGTQWLPWVAVWIAGIFRSRGGGCLLTRTTKPERSGCGCRHDRATKLANRLRWVNFVAFLRLTTLTGSSGTSHPRLRSCSTGPMSDS